MDTVEFVIEVEQAFGIEISDEAAASMATPGMVIDYIMAQQADGADLSSPPTRFIKHLQKALALEGISIDPETLPDSDLEALLPRKGRQALWRKLQSKHKVKLSPLERPHWLVVTLALGVLSSAIPCALIIADGVQFTILAVVGMTVTLGLLARELSHPLANEIPAQLRPLAKRIELHAAHFPEAPKQPGTTLTREQVAAVVRAITCEYCKPADYREDAHFIRDLGLT